MEQYTIRSTLVIPLIVKGEVLGTLSFYYRTTPRAFTEAQIDFANKLATSISLALGNAKLYEAERNIADTLQEALITMPDRIDGIEFGHLYRSATEATKVGGDFYDLFALEHGKVGVLVGDVAGKGLDAAALTSVVKNAVKAHAYEDSTPAMILSKTNDLVAKISSPGEFVTMVFGVLDMATGTLTYCSAGHPPAMIKRKEGGVELLGKHSPMIGAFSGIHYRSDKAVLNKGDILVLYTDGLIEARCNGGFFGEERLVKLLANSGPIPAKELPRLLIDTLTECAGGKLADDTAILAVSLQNM
ncbi:MAG: SpoIIE family protein phosphatase [Actinobacteria bacterium]|nr:SpoIIE family protein phosphatase [Actinomycetota bacterium]